MHSPEQLLSQLQSLIEPEMGYQLQFPNHEDGGELEPFIWNIEQQGQFTLLGLLQSQGWLHELEPATLLDSVLNKWTAPEQVGSVNGEAWIVPEDDPAKILLDDNTKATRLQLYQTLLQHLQTDLQHLQAFELSCNSDYSLVILVGQRSEPTHEQANSEQTKPESAAHQWLCLAPSVPHATAIDQNAPLQMVAVPNPSTIPKLSAPIQTALEPLQPVQLYGYYGGGYNQVHEYRLITASGNTQEQAMEQALFAAGLLEQFKFEAFKPSDQKKQFERLTHFLQENFSDLQVYRVSFWNDEHFYIVGKYIIGKNNAETENAIWGGVVLHSKFTYNP
jgi:hypothetical protein